MPNCLGVTDYRVLCTLRQTFAATEAKVASSFERTVCSHQTRLSPVISTTAEGCRSSFVSTYLPDESVAGYLTTLRVLFTIWKFGGPTDELICDQLMEKTHRCEIRDRLVLESDVTPNIAL